jgi:hypothetical protein
LGSALPFTLVPLKLVSIIEVRSSASRAMLLAHPIVLDCSNSVCCLVLCASYRKCVSIGD